MKNSPIKRHPGLIELSRDHHHALLLCWKIRQGLRKGIAPERIFPYAQHFYKTALQKHFQEEETWVFPLLGESNPRVATALAQHAQLNQLFTEKQQDTSLETQLNSIADKLEEHIRFEERTLFQEIQEQVADEILTDLAARLAPNGEKSSADDWEDPFWEKDVV